MTKKAATAFTIILRTVRWMIVHKGRSRLALSPIGVGKLGTRDTAKPEAFFYTHQVH